MVIFLIFYHVFIVSDLLHRLPILSLLFSDASRGPEGIPDLRDPGSSRVEKLKSLPNQFDSSGLVELQREAVSTDGTMVPYFVICRADMVHDGNTPTVLYGYGGFEISMTPAYLGTTGVTWVERGGCYVGERSDN